MASAPDSPASARQGDMDSKDEAETANGQHPMTFSAAAAADGSSRLTLTLVRPTPKTTFAPPPSTAQMPPKMTAKGDDEFCRPVTVGRKRRFKNPLAPKRPQTAYIRFLVSKQNELRQRYPTDRTADITRKAGQMWSSLSSEEKQPYVEAYNAEKLQFNEAMQRFVGAGHLVDVRHGGERASGGLTADCYGSRTVSLLKQKPTSAEAAAALKSLNFIMPSESTKPGKRRPGRPRKNPPRPTALVPEVPARRAHRPPTMPIVGNEHAADYADSLNKATFPIFSPQFTNWNHEREKRYRATIGRLREMRESEDVARACYENWQATTGSLKRLARVKQAIALQIVEHFKGSKLPGFEPPLTEPVAFDFMQHLGKLLTDLPVGEARRKYPNLYSKVDDFQHKYINSQAIPQVDTS